MRRLLLCILTVMCLCATTAFVACGKSSDTPETPATYTVTVAVNEQGYGTVSQASVTNVAKDTAITKNGATLTIGDVTITATPAAETEEYTYEFVNWTAATKVTGNITVTANFTRTEKGEPEVYETGLNIKTVTIAAGDTFDLSDYPVTLPTTDCNFFLAEMLVSAWPCNLTMKVTDTEDEDNYFIIRATITKRVPEREGEVIDGPDGMIEFTYQKAGGEESDPVATILAYWEDMGSGGTNADSFTGYVWQLQYNPSGTIGCFNVGSSFISTDDFSAEKVTVSLTSDINVKIGLRYFGDTQNWDLAKADDNPVPNETALVKKTLYLKAGDTFEMTDYPITLPTTDCTYFLAEILVSNPTNLTMKVTDVDDEDNYFELLMDVQSGSLSYAYRIADGLRSTTKVVTLAFWQDMGSGGQLEDSFTGQIIQLQYNPESGNRGCFNVPSSFTGLDGFTAERVIVSFTSPSDVTIGIRYFGDTKDWRLPDVEPEPEPEPEPVGTLNVKTVELEAGATCALSDYPVTLPTTDCNFFLAEMYVSNDANIVMRLTDAENAENYCDLKLSVEGSTLTMTYQKAGGTESAAYSGTLAFSENVGSGGSLSDSFTGHTVQVVYNGGSGTIGRFNEPESFKDLDGFTASSVVISFTSDVAVNIGIRYFGDTLDWKTA